MKNTFFRITTGASLFLLGIAMIVMPLLLGEFSFEFALLGAFLIAIVLLISVVIGAIRP